MVRCVDLIESFLKTRKCIEWRELISKLCSFLHLKWFQRKINQTIISIDQISSKDNSTLSKKKKPQRRNNIFLLIFSGRFIWILQRIKIHLTEKAEQKKKKKKEIIKTIFAHREWKSLWILRIVMKRKWKIVTITEKII